MAVRYDQKTKDAVVAFIVDYNEKNGRGGQSAAAKKFKVTPITISSWLKKAGVKSKGKKRKTKAPRATATAAAPSKPATRKPRVRSKSGVLSRMLKIQSQIEELEAEYDSLKGQL